MLIDTDLHVINPSTYHFLPPSNCSKIHLIFKSPPLLHAHPYKPLRITSYTVLFIEMHSISRKCYINIQALQEHYIFTAIIYLLILLRMTVHWTNTTQCQ